MHWWNYLSVYFTRQLNIWNSFSEDSVQLDLLVGYILSQHEFLSLEQLITLCCIIITHVSTRFWILHTLVGILNYWNVFWVDKSNKQWQWM